MYIKAKAKILFSDIKQPICAAFLCMLVARYAVYVLLPLRSSRLHHIDCTLCSDSTGCQTENMTLQIVTDVKLTFSTCTLMFCWYI